MHVESPRELCAQCGFDSDLYDRADTLSSMSIVPAVLRAAVEGLDAATMNRRPNAETWSVGEYLDHVHRVVSMNRLGVEAAVAEPGIDFGDPPDADGIAVDPAQIDASRALAGIEAAYREMHALLASLDEAGWSAWARLGGDDVSVSWFARHVLHDGLHHFADIGRIRHAFALGAARQTGTIVQLNVSNGGVPKRPVERVEIGPAGLVGDVQADRRHHGRPVQAVCLWSADVIAELVSEGHPIAAGNAGENVTIADVDWAALLPGSRIDVGSVELLVTAHAIPCAKNAQWFADRDFSRILHEDSPGRSRLYALPLSSGTVHVGETVVVEP